MRKATESYRVPNTDITIPKGMRVFIPVYAIHHDERFHSDPEIFNPERDLTCGKTYIPFGRGSGLLRSHAIVLYSDSDLSICH